MENRWLGFFAFIWIIGSLLMITYNGATTGDAWNSAGYSSGNMTTTMNNLTQANVATQKIPIIGSISFLTPALNFMESLFNIITWNFNFVQPYPIIARILNVFAIIGVVGVFRMLYSSVTGNISWG